MLSMYSGPSTILSMPNHFHGIVFFHSTLLLFSLQDEETEAY